MADRGNFGSPENEILFSSLEPRNCRDYVRLILSGRAIRESLKSNDRAGQSVLVSSFATFYPQAR